ncbi:MAG: hypothetical protein WC873_04510 [Candidatus Gracilibacteria bacterium]
MKQPTSIEKVLVPIIALAIIAIAFLYPQKDIVPSEPEIIEAPEIGTTEIETPQTPPVQEEVDSKCDKAFNHDPANTTVNYTNAEKGISIDLPYNPNWYENPTDPPYSGDLLPETEIIRVDFGPQIVFEACSWLRTYMLNIHPQEDFTEFKVTLETSFSLASPQTEVIEKEFNGLKALEYVGMGLCSYPTVLIFGEKANYELVPLCSGNHEKDFEFMEGIAKTIKLI